MPPGISNGVYSGQYFYSEMKILHVIDSAGVYGAEVVVLNLMEAQEEIGLQPLLLSLGDTNIGVKDIELEARKRDFESYSLRFRNGLNLFGAMKILRCASDLGAQIIHSHGYKGDILLGVIPKIFCKIPVVVTLHGWSSTQRLSKIWVYEWMDALFIKKMDKLVVVSSAMKGHTRLKSLGINPDVIHNGIPRLDFENDYDFSIAFPEISKVCRDKFKIISIGRLSPEKGVDVLIRAMGLLVSSGIDAYLVIFGEGKEKTSLRQLALKENVSERVCFAGYQNKAYRFIPFFDVFVLPSFTEGLPITLLEAMQAEIPIVATSVGEVPSVLDNGRCGMLVSSRDAEALGKSIEEVYTNRNGAKIKAIAARERVLRVYSLENMAKKYYEVYQRMISVR